MIQPRSSLPLRSYPDFFAQSRQIRSLSFTAFVRKSPVGHFRTAIIVPKKMQRLATHRNKLKRVLKAQLAFAGVTQKAIDIVIYVHNERRLHDTETVLLELQELRYSIGSSLSDLQNRN